MASQKIVDGQVVGYQLDHTAQQVDDGITHAEELFAAALYTGGTLFGNANNHRNIYRGKYLGTSVTNDQKTAIANGTFTDLYVGDYWTINSVNWVIADFDYWYQCGDTTFTKHHLVIVPAASLYSAKMNDTNTTGITVEGGAGAYVGSLMYRENLDSAKTTISNAFGNMVLTHREYLQNAVSNGYASGGAWFNSTVDLMNEPMVYGSYIHTAGSNGSTIVNRYTIGKQQLALFRLNPKAINIRAHWWLRDVVSAAAFAAVNGYGAANCGNASFSYGVRPAFAIGNP